ncbi:hypothetical protein PTKU46_97100 [Paraburkholderia terrae]
MRHAPLTQDSPLDNPFLESLGARLSVWCDGYAELTMPIDATKLYRQRVLQGGAIATLQDAATGYAGIFSMPGEVERHAFTLSLTTNFLDKGQGHHVKAIGTLERTEGRFSLRAPRRGSMTRFLLQPRKGRSSMLVPRAKHLFKALCGAYPT